LPLFGLLAFALTQYDWSRVSIEVLPEAEAPLARVTTSQIGMALLGFPQETKALRPSATRNAPDDAHAGEHLPPLMAEQQRLGRHEEPGHEGLYVKVRSSGYLLPFEIVSVHLVVVLVGAAYLARARRGAAQGEQ
jgi:hypothetical protein